MKFTFLCGFLMGLVQVSFGQELETEKPFKPERSALIADRPGQHTEATTVGDGTLQIETGFSFLKDDRYYRQEKEFHFPKLALRYGLSSRFELRLQAQLQQNELSYHGSSFQYIEDRSWGPGLNNLRIGTKFQLTNDPENRNALALQLETRLPLESREYRTRFLVPEIKLAFRKDLSPAFSYLLNLGVDLQDPGGDYIVVALTPIYALALQYNVTKLLVFGEVSGSRYYGYPFQHTVGFGLAYKLTQNFQLDASAGLPLNDEAPDLLLSGGFSFRLLRNEKR